MNDFVRGLMWVRTLVETLRDPSDIYGQYCEACTDIIDAIDAKMEDLANQETRYEPSREI